MSLLLESMPTINPVRPEPVEGLSLSKEGTARSTRYGRRSPWFDNAFNPEHGQRFAALSMSFPIAKN